MPREHCSFWTPLTLYVPPKSQDLNTSLKSNPHCTYTTRNWQELKRHRRLRRKAGDCSTKKRGRLATKPRYKCAHCSYVTLETERMDHHQRLRREFGKCHGNDRRCGERYMRSCMLPGRPEIVVSVEREASVPPAVTDVEEEAA